MLAYELKRKGHDPDPAPDPYFERVQHVWAVDFYTITVEITSALLLLVYLITFYRAWVGTRYPFILILTLLLFLANIGALLCVIYGHQAIHQKDEELDIEQIVRTLNLSTSFELVKEGCTNVAIWLFSFRYWNIAYIMPVHLAGKQVTACFKSVSITIFFTGIVLSILMPTLYAVQSFKLNNCLIDGVEVATQTWFDLEKRFYWYKYMTGAVKSISAIFLLWAIFKLYLASGRSLTLKELMDQRMVIAHIVTLLVYMASVLTYYIYFMKWDATDETAEIKVYVSWTICTIMITLVQLSLIFLFWGLSKKQPEASRLYDPISSTEQESIDEEKMQGSDMKFQKSRRKQKLMYEKQSDLYPKIKITQCYESVPTSTESLLDSKQAPDVYEMLDGTVEESLAPDREGNSEISDETDSNVQEMMMKRSSVMNAIRQKQHMEEYQARNENRTSLHLFGIMQSREAQGSLDQRILGILTRQGKMDTSTSRSSNQGSFVNQRQSRVNTQSWIKTDPSHQLVKASDSGQISSTQSEHKNSIQFGQKSTHQSARKFSDRRITVKSVNPVETSLNGLEESTEKSALESYLVEEEKSEDQN